MLKTFDMSSGAEDELDFSTTITNNQQTIPLYEHAQTQLQLQLQLAVHETRQSVTPAFAPWLAANQEQEETTVQSIH